MTTLTTIYSIGYGNRPPGRLFEELQAYGIGVVVDIRAYPQSRHQPDYNREVLQQAAESRGLVYHWAGRHLGGMRSPRPHSPHIALQASMRGYADHMESDPFEVAVAQLISLASREPTVMMCAEEDPCRCHRRLLSDFLVLKGYVVTHLRRDIGSSEHVISEEARRESAVLVYDRMATAELKF